MKRHIDAEVLASYRAGDLSARRSGRIGAHLGGCTRCTGLSEDLRRVSTLLAAAPAPPIPEHLAVRIQAAIITEAASRAGPGRATTPATATATAPGTAAPATTAAPPIRDNAAGGRARPNLAQRNRARHTRQGWRLRLPSISTPVAARALAAAAAVVVIAGGGYLLARGGTGSVTGSSGAASGSGASESHPAAGRAALPGTAGPELHYARAGHQASFTPIAADTEFARGNVREKVRAILTSASGSPPGQPGLNANLISPKHGPAPTSGTANSGAFRNLSFPALEGCVSRVSAGSLVLLVEIAKFGGSPATVIVTRIAQAKPLQIWIVGPGCSASATDVLLRTTLSSGGG